MSFEGHDGRECGEHRTTGMRAWCHDCSEWCYDGGPCKGCELPRLRAEFDFLLARLDPTRARNCTGISSDALTLYALGRAPAPARRDYPWDCGDLARCERTYAMAPPHLQERMRPVLEAYRAAIPRKVGT